jgi:hypothetical protein
VNTENVVKHLRVLWRTDRIIAAIRHLLVGLGLRAFAAALIAALDLLILELSAILRWFRSGVRSAPPPSLASR